MVFGVSDVSMTPKTNIIYFWSHQDTSNNSRIPSYIFEKYDILKSPNFGIYVFNSFGIGGRQNNLNTRFHFSENLEYGINILQKT